MTSPTGRWDTSHRLTAPASQRMAQAAQFDPFEVPGVDYPVPGLVAADYSKIEARVLAQLNGLDLLEAIMDGHTVLSSHPLRALGQLKPRSAPPAYFSLAEPFGSDHASREALHRFNEASKKARVKGNSYRGSEAQSALRNKNKGNRVLIVPEPANPHDPHGLAVLVAATRASSQDRYDWVHVGYIPREIALVLSPVWPKKKGRACIGEGEFEEAPGQTSNPRIRFTGWRVY